MKTLRPYTFLVLTALTILGPLGSVWAAPPEAFLSDADADADGQVSGNLSNSRAGLMTLQGLTGRNELTYGALPWFGLQGNWGQNYQRQDYYTPEWFIPWNLTPGTDYFFTEGGMSFTQNGRLAGNFGLGYGYYLSDWDRLLRTFGYGIVDGQYQKTRMGVGLVVENLGKYVDHRAQAFFVTSDSIDLVNRSLTGGGHFTGNEFCIDGIGIQETAYHHVDYELGGPLAYLGDYGISAYGKAYYLFNTQNNSNDSVGFGVRGEWTWTEDLTFNVNYTHDNVFNDSTWFTVAMTTPDGAPRNIARPISVRERFSKSVVRDKRIRTYVETQQFCVPLLNPKTGAPYVFAHVDPNQTDGTGNGTFERPYASIDMMTNNNKLNYNIIYVRPRADDSAINLTVMQQDGVAQAATPLLLFPNQLLLGSTIDQTVDVIPQPFLPTSKYTIPALDPGRLNPYLMNGNNAPGAIVYASRGNLISGFDFDGTSPGGTPNFHNGIGLDYDSMLGGLMGLTPDGVGQDLHVRNNNFLFMNVAVNAPDLSDGTPHPLCSLLGSSSLWNNTFAANNVGFDIQIDQTNDASPDDPVDGTNLSLSILANTADSNGTGGIVAANGPGKTVDLSARDLNGDGITDPVLAGNLFSNNSDDGLVLRADLGGLMLADVGANPNNVPNPALGLVFNTFTGNGNSGLTIEATSDDTTGVPSIIRGNIIANDFSDPADGGDGLHINTTGDTNTLAFIDFGNSAGDNGLTGTPNDTLDAFTGVIDLNLFNRQNTGFAGVVANVTDGSADLHFTRNIFDATGSATAGPGLDVGVFSTALPNGNPNAQMVLLVGGTPAQGNLFDANRDAGAIFRVGGFIGNPPAAQLRSFAQFENNVFQNTTDDPTTNDTNSPTGDGIIIDRQDGALLTAIVGDGVTDFANGNLFFNNEGSGVHVIGAGSNQQAANGFLASFFYINENVFQQNGEGIGVDLIADTVIQGVAVRNTITDSANDGIDVNTFNHTAFGMPIQPTLGEDLNGDGILQPWEDLNFNGLLDVPGVMGVNNTVLSSLFDSNLISGFGNDGISLSSLDFSFNNVRISGYQLSDPNDPTSVIRTMIDGGLTGNNGINIIAGGTQIVDGGPNSLYTIQGVDVRNVDGNGITVAGVAGTNVYNIGGPGLGQYVTLIGNAADDIGSNGLNVIVTSGLHTFNINTLYANNNQGDGANFLQTGGGLAVNLTSSRFNMNDGTGFTADIRSTANTFPDQGTGGGVIGTSTVNESHAAVFNIGTEDTAYISKAAGINTIVGNNRLLDTVLANGLVFEDTNHNGILDAGEDVNGDGVLNFGEDLNGNGTVNTAADSYASLGNMFNNNGLQGFFWQTLSSNGGAGSGLFLSEAPHGNIYQNVFGGGVDVSARLNFTRNQVLSNGARLGNNVDGMVLQMGTNSRTSAYVDGNLFGGNVLDDFRTNVVVGANPADSVNDAVAGPPILDLVVFDPVAYLDLSFGENFGTPGIAPRLTAPDNPTGAGLGNIGEAINISTVGTNTPLVGRTETGLFTNADLFKGGNRAAYGYFNVLETSGTGADLDVSNLFTQLAVPPVPPPGPVANEFNNNSFFIPSIILPPTRTINYINQPQP